MLDCYCGFMHVVFVFVIVLDWFRLFGYFVGFFVGVGLRGF